jgi:hypothetical protein
VTFSDQNQIDELVQVAEVFLARVAHCVIDDAQGFRGVAGASDHIDAVPAQAISEQIK